MPSRIKPNAKDCVFKEQIFEDKVSGITLQFHKYDNGETRLSVYGGCLPFGNRDLIFNEEGSRLVGAGTAVAGACPSWLREVPKEED